jgi:hypothetical protein
LVLQYLELGVHGFSEVARAQLGLAVAFGALVAHDALLDLHAQEVRRRADLLRVGRRQAGRFEVDGREVVQDVGADQGVAAVVLGHGDELGIDVLGVAVGAEALHPLGEEVNRVGLGRPGRHECRGGLLDRGELDEQRLDRGGVERVAG